MKESEKDALLEEIEGRLGVEGAIDLYCDSSSDIREQLVDFVEEAAEKGLYVVKAVVPNAADRSFDQTFALFTRERISPEQVREWGEAMALETED